MKITADKITYVDVEYANSSSRSLCQIGLICENPETGELISEPQLIYINPEDEFSWACIKCHGTTEDDVKEAPIFPEVWESIKEHFRNSIIVGHNVDGADLDALVKNCKRYNLDVPEMYYICTQKLAKEYIPKFTVAAFNLGTLCNFFDIEPGDHNALNDAAACRNLFKILVEYYGIELNKHVTQYIHNKSKNTKKKTKKPALCQSISDIYGILIGINIDNEINPDEIEAIKRWKEEHQNDSSEENIASIIETIDRILEKNSVSSDDIRVVQREAYNYLDKTTTAEITLARQIFYGVLKGISADRKVTETECQNLRELLYEHSDLRNEYPFYRIYDVLEKVLEDSVITKEEEELVKAVISEILKPREALCKLINSVNGKSVCLSGDFDYGSKQRVEEYIISKGGTIDQKLKKTTNILLLGNKGSNKYSDGDLGTKFIDAQNYNYTGCDIQVIIESNFIFEAE